MQWLNLKSFMTVYGVANKYLYCSSATNQPTAFHVKQIKLSFNFLPSSVSYKNVQSGFEYL